MFVSFSGDFAYNMDTVSTIIIDILKYYRLSDHSDFVRILLILLENPESCQICDQDRKNPDFDIFSDIFK